MRQGVGRNQRARDDVLDDVAWLRENGYRRATVGELAMRLGMSKKALEHHLARGRQAGDPRAVAA